MRQAQNDRRKRVREPFKVEDADDAWRAAHAIQADLATEENDNPSSRALRFARRKARAIAEWASKELKLRGEK